MADLMHGSNQRILDEFTLGELLRVHHGETIALELCEEDAAACRRKLAQVHEAILARLGAAGLVDPNHDGRKHPGHSCEPPPSPAEALRRRGGGKTRPCRGKRGP